MSKSLSVKIVLCSLVVTGTWGVHKILSSDQRNSQISSQPISARQQTVTEKGPSAQRQLATNTTSSKNEFDAFKQAKNLLSKGQTQTALSLINQYQIALSSQQLDELKAVFFRYISTLKSLEKFNLAERDLIIFSQYFDELVVWDELVKISASLNKPEQEFHALTRAAALESQPDILQTKISRLEVLASSIKKGLNSQNDLLGIRMLYQDLLNQHPSSTRFAYELALAQLNIGDNKAAKQLLLPLQYDLEFGGLVASHLAKIDDLKRQQTTPEVIKKNKAEFAASDLVVPLSRRGNSFLVDTSINGRRVNMLLDTGASITSLSSQQIQRLGLAPTGRSIRLSTANGERNAALYRAEKIRLGRLTVEGLVVAEIEFDSNSPIQGLLGTDLLNRVNHRYNYLIDNNANALIFRPKLN